MSHNFVFTPEAEADVLAIWKYIAEDDSADAADKLIARIYSECLKLGELPGIGHWREDLIDRRHRFWSLWSYLIVYRWQTTPIQVIAIVHGARNLDAFFANEDRLTP